MADIFCGNCQTTTTIVDGYYCHCCDQMLCIYCGCTDEEPCEEICWWTSDGVCSNCYDGLAEGNF